ncbi:MAG: hydroxyisourate hydrolase [Tepidisphaeraceae bacterium]|jgi:5-hydroxyisourate hydrolase
MAGKLTTHVLDIANGCPAADVKVSLHRDGQFVAHSATNADGRLPSPLVSGDSFFGGHYRLEFAIGDYFAARGHPDARKFLDLVRIDFIVDDSGGNYHVPLLVSPWSYSTYRGS